MSLWDGERAYSRRNIGAGRGKINRAIYTVFQCVNLMAAGWIVTQRTAASGGLKHSRSGLD
jgi:hypothetical protein